MDQISFQFSGWYFLLCAVVGVLMAALLYFRSSQKLSLTTPKLWVLSLLRFLCITGLCIFLLEPFFTLIEEDEQQPVIVSLLDVSESTEEFRNDEFLTEYQNTLSALEEPYDLINLEFAENINLATDTAKIDPKLTNISRALSYVDDYHSDQNLGAVIMSSDGILNEGQNPIYQRLDIQAPIYTIGLGDTTVTKDANIKYVYHNKIAYLNDQFNVQVDAQAAMLRGTPFTVSISQENNGKYKKIGEKRFTASSDEYFTTQDFTLDADRVGVIKYRVDLAGANDESNRQNNRYEFYVEVLDSRLKIKLLAAAPHPDLGALKNLLENNKNYDVELLLAKDITSNSLDADFVIFHNLPSDKFDITGILSQINNRKLPRAYIVGRQTNLQKINKAQGTLQIRSNSNQSNEVQAVLNGQFKLFNISDQAKTYIPTLVPLLAPFGEYQTGPTTEVLAWQRIGSIDTKYPLMAFSDQDQIKTFVIAGEGLWRWKLIDFAQNGSFNIVNELIDKAVSYTSVKEDRRKFQVSCAKNVFRQDESIIFDAELYNNSYERINTPEAYLKIKNKAGQEFDFVFSKTSDAYILDASTFEPGRYDYTARCTWNGEQFTATGGFSVQATQLEMNQLTADHNLLRNLSTQYGGQFYLPDELSALRDSLLASDQIRPIIYASSRTMSILHLRWLFFLLFGFLALEWFLRRYFGAY